MVQKALLDVVQSILEQADSLPSMSQSLYRTNVFVYKDTDEIAPDIRSRSLTCEPSMLKPLDFSHLKTLCEASHNVFYDKHIIMQSKSDCYIIKMLVA